MFQTDVTQKSDPNLFLRDIQKEGAQFSHFFPIL